MQGHWLTTLWHPAVLLLALYNFLALMAEWGVNFWLPTVLKETGLSIGTVGLLAALPYALGIVMMILVARSSDRLRERKWHMIAATALLGHLPAARAARRRRTARSRSCVFLSLAVGSFLGRFGPFWTLPTEVLPPAVAGVGIGLINGTGNLGGTVGPYFFGYVRTVTGSFTLALTVGGISLILASLVAIPIRNAHARREPRPLAAAPRLPDLPDTACGAAPAALALTGEACSDCGRWTSPRSPNPSAAPGRASVACGSKRWRPRRACRR